MKSLVFISEEGENMTDSNPVLNEQSVNEHFGLFLLTIQNGQIKCTKCCQGLFIKV